MGPASQAMAGPLFGAYKFGYSLFC